MPSAKQANLLKARYAGLCAALAALICLALSFPTQAQRLSGERSLSNTKWGYQIVRDTTRAGRRAQRFEVRPGDCYRNEGWNDCTTDRERSEIRLKKSWRYGTVQWIGFSVFLPPDFQTSARVNTTVGQIHQKGGPSGTARGLPSFPPLVQLEMRGNSYRAGIHILTGSATNVRDDVRYLDLARIDQMRGRWTDVALHLDTRNGAQLFEVYIDGIRRAQIRDFINFVPKDFRFKYGIYRSFVSKHGGPMPTQILYIDEVRMGRSGAAVVVNEKRPVD